LVHPARLGTKGTDLRGISHTNLPYLVNQSFLVQKQSYKLASRKLTKRQVEAIQNLPSPLAIDTPIRPLRAQFLKNLNYIIFSQKESKEEGGGGGKDRVEK